LRVHREIEWKGIQHFVYAISRDDFLRGSDPLAAYERPW
jgi:hypothetical protein